MHQWEVESWAASHAVKNNADPSSIFTEIKDKQETIFEKFCTQKPRPYGRLGSFQKPPEYDPLHEYILDVTEERKGRVLIRTKQTTGFQETFQYVLLWRTSGWRIDNKKIIDSDGSVHQHCL